MPMTSSPESLRSSLERILSEIDALRGIHVDEGELHEQVQISQIQVMRLYVFALKHRLLPSWIEIPPDADLEPQLLILWERLALALERLFPHRLPHITDIAKMRVPIPGQDRSLNLVPRERVRKWVDHAAQLVVLLIEHLLPRKTIRHEREALIQRSWYTAERSAELLGYVRGHITRLVSKKKLEGENVDGKLYVNPVCVHAHPRYNRQEREDERPASAERPVVEAIKYECCTCQNVVTAPPGRPPERCPKCNDQSTLIKQRPKR